MPLADPKVSFLTADKGEVRRHILPFRKSNVPADKRKTHRWKFCTLCIITWKNAQFAGTIIDLSETGAFIEVQGVPPPEGTILTVEFEEDEVSLRLQSRVVHAGWYLEKYRNLKGFGVCFKTLDPRAIAVIQKMLDRSREPAPDKCILEP